MRFASALAVAALAMAPAVAAAQDLNTARTQTLEITVQATDIFTISNTGTIPLSVAATGSAQTFSNAGGTYTVQTNAQSGDERNITASISANTTGLTVEVNLSYAGATGTSAGFVTLLTTSTPVVTGIAASSHTGNISYRLTAQPTVAATGGSPLSKTVTFTLVDAVP